MRIGDNINGAVEGTGIKVSINGKTTKFINKNSDKGNVFAGNINIPSADIQEKRKKAQKEAMAIMGKVYKSDKKTDTVIADTNNNVKELQKEINVAQKSIDGIENQKESLKKAYEINDDSDEQNDLKLLQKDLDIKNGNHELKLTDDEKERLENLKRNGITEYQSRYLELHKQEYQYKDTIDNNKKIIEAENAAVKSISLERLKSHAMVDAGKEAENILDNANKSIIAEAIQDAKDSIDEKMDEDKQKAEEKKEKEDKLQEHIDKIKEDKELQQEQIEQIKENAGNNSNSYSTDINDSSDNNSTNKNIEKLSETLIENSNIQSDSGKEIEKVLEKLNLLEDDIKGIAVDSNI